MEMLRVILLAALAATAAGTSSFPNPTAQGKSWGPCSSAVSAVAAQGDGSTPGSCMSCDPTYPKCPPKCQPLINTLYRDCDGVYTPPGLFFDPASQISGYWGGQINRTRIAVERCGCNHARQITPSPLTSAISIVAALLTLNIL